MPRTGVRVRERELAQVSSASGGIYSGVARAGLAFRSKEKALPKSQSRARLLKTWWYPGVKKKKKDFLFPEYRLEMASERWAVRQYQYSYGHPYDPYYSYSHTYAAWNCSYFATTTLA